MKKAIVHLTSIYSLVLVISLLIYSVEQSSLVSLLVLFPVFVYFLISVTHISPAVGKIFFQKKTRPAELICGVYTLVFSNVVLIANMIHIRSVIQLILCLSILPVVIHLWLRLSKVWITFANRRTRVIKQETKVESVEPVIIEEVKEKERRVFLKMILGAGAGMLVASILNPKKASAAFFGSVPGPGVVGVKNAAGSAINPSEKSPTDGFGISNLDTGSYPAYFGFINKDGGWYVMKENPQNTFTYAKGASDYATNWSGRAGLTYDTFDVIFS